MTGPSGAGDLARLLRLHGETALLRIESRALAGNGLGDPAVRDLPVYLPGPAGRAPESGYPVLYFLPSYGSDARGAVAPAPWKESVFQRVDRLIAQGEMQPVIVVAVDGWTRLGGSQYVDSVQNGRYAEFVLREVMPAVEAAYPAVAGSRGRALFGKSSGGFGALHIALRYPGFVAAIAAHSADGYFPYSAVPAFLRSYRVLRGFDFDYDAFVRFFEGSPAPPADDFEALMMLAYAAAYSPRSSAPFDFAMPFRRADGALDDAVFAEWTAFDPVREVDDRERRENLRELRLCYLDSGDRDEYGLDLASRMLHQKVGGAACVYEEFSGGHRGNTARYDRSLTLLARTLHEGLAGAA